MATSSITANFHTDDPMVANKIVCALFAPTTPAQPHERECYEVKQTPEECRAFFSHLVKKARAMTAAQ